LNLRLFLSHHTPIAERYTLSLHDALPILVPNDWYYTTVKAVNGAGLEEADTSNGQQYIDITVGMEELIRQSVYPNPTTGIINLPDRKSTRLNSSHVKISYAVFCLKKKNKK